MIKKEILDDNYFEREDEFQDDIDFIDRWKGMFVEGFIIGIFAIILNTLAENIGILGKGDEEMMHQKMLMILLFVILLFVILNKDFLNGQSVVKHYFGYQIMDMKTRKPANETQCVIRNFTVILNWIILIVATIFPRRRIGDALAGTMLVRVKKEKSTKYFFNLKLNSTFLLSLIIEHFIVGL